ncbi:unnamed protein product [Urochloa decumbens]|uniref:Uncharacterized protein n=1 Tax=Urochloa decumbens TaxID=240449 RepID=A0ABC9BYT7_9POAL
MAGEMTERAATTVFVALLSGDDDYCKVVVELAERLHKADSPCQLVVAVLPAVPESRRAQRPHLAWLRRPRLRGRARAPTGEPGPPCHRRLRRQAPHLGFVEYERLVYLNPVMNTTSGDDDKAAWSTAELGLPPPPPYFNADTFVLEPSIVTGKDMLEALRVMSHTPVAHHQDFLNILFKDQYKPILLEEKLALSMLENKATKCPLADKKLPPFSSWLPTTKEVIFARKNLSAMATLAVSSAAAGVITTAANPAICFGFYAVFIAAIAFVTISIREI